jgi:flagellin-like hook-associated protein FlgL
VVDASAQAVRSNLVKQCNGILARITTTSQDASFNGVNLLGGDDDILFTISVVARTAKLTSP